MIITLRTCPPDRTYVVCVVVALSGNALLRRSQPADAEHQCANVASAIAAIAELTGNHQVVVTHGNSPQVGLLALQSDAPDHVTAYSLDVLGAESEGMIGYLLEQQLINALDARPVATLLTQVIVDADDPAVSRAHKRGDRPASADVTHRRVRLPLPYGGKARGRSTGRSCAARPERESEGRAARYAMLKEKCREVQPTQCAAHE